MASLGPVSEPSTDMPFFTHIKLTSFIHLDLPEASHCTLPIEDVSIATVDRDQEGSAASVQGKDASCSGQACQAQENFPCLQYNYVPSFVRSPLTIAVIGTEAWKLDDTNKPANVKLKPGDTTGWRVYVRPVPNGPDLTAWLKKVIFVIHETFPNPVRTIENPPFELEETGYGGFMITVKLHFHAFAAEKQQLRQHWLQLEPYGDEKLQEEQKRQNLVRSEIVEIIEFNEPTDQLWDALTSESQWGYLNPPAKGRGKGKNKAPQGPTMSAEHRNIELPENAPPGSVWSKEQENLLLKQLADAEARVDAELAKVQEQRIKINSEIQRVKGASNVDQKLSDLHDKIPAKKK